MASSLEDVGKSPGGDAIVSFLRVAHDDNGAIKVGGAAGTLSQVLTNGADAGGLEITDGADPTAPQSLATKNYVDTHVGGGGGLSAAPVTFSQAGTLTTGTGTLRWLCPWTTATINGVVASAGTAPTGSSIICDVNKNGTTIFTTQANRPTIAVSAHATSVEPVPDVNTIVFGDYLTVDIDQVGSTVAGADLVVVVAVTRTS